MGEVLEFRPGSSDSKEITDKKKEGVDELFKDIQEVNKLRKQKEWKERAARNAAIVSGLTKGKGRPAG